MTDEKPLQTVRTIKLLNEALFTGITLEDGQVERPLPDGGIVTATFKKGAIVSYAARDENNKPLSVLLLKMEPGEPVNSGFSITAPAKECWFCFCDDDHCQCTPERCPDPPS